MTYVRTRLVALVASVALSAAAFAERTKYHTLFPTAAQSPSDWHYTTTAPAADAWASTSFDDSGWETGPAGFGTAGTPGATVRTTWDTSDIWLRRDVTVPADRDLSKTQFLLIHDEDAQVFLNGVPAASATGHVGSYQPTPISKEAIATLHPGHNLIAVHCHQTIGGQFIDVGLAVPVESPAGQYIPPAIPLVTHDPYFSVWSTADNLADDNPRHWTDAPNTLTSTITIDGKPYRLMGSTPSDAAALYQDSVEVLPTRTIYRFAGAGIHVNLFFTTPAIITDVNLLTRPVTYVTWDVTATDDRQHAVAVRLGASKQLVTFDGSQPAVAETLDFPNLTAARIGSKAQPVLQRAGDHTRIDWGYLYLAAPTNPPARLSTSDDEVAITFDLGQVSNKSTEYRTVMLAYDEAYAIQLMGKNLRPYWRHDGSEPRDLLAAAWKDFVPLRKRCAQFDQELMADLVKAGGGDYARIGALAYRQALAGNGYAASDDGKLLMFPKENTSNGCIATVDVHYPASPMYALFNPSLLEAQLDPVFDYAESGRWKWPFAPHDLGTYPKANGQVYGGGERTVENQMPVEESGNMILMVAAIAKARGDASYAGKHWDALTKWTAYLRDKGFDPENQLCTDDFMGHLAHNVNLSAKTIEAIGAYAMLADLLGHKDQAKECRQLAEQFAARWVKEADDGDHFRLAFDKPGTWSQKYNLVWDRILGLNLFPKDAIRKEVAFYLDHQNPYGLPLDNRAPNTKTDWLCWTATLSDKPTDFATLTAPIAKFLADTPSRVPFSDWYNTQDAHIVGFIARPVIGGVFVKLLDDPATWHKWADRSK